MKNTKIALGIGIVALIILYVFLMYKERWANTKDETTSQEMTTAACEAKSGRVAYGIGPAPSCEAGETSIGYITDTNAIEGAICCIKSS